MNNLYKGISMLNIYLKDKTNPLFIKELSYYRRPGHLVMHQGTGYWHSYENQFAQVLQ